MDLLKPRCETPAIDHPAAFRAALGEWFSTEGKDYPWRRTKNPYEILVSEMMLQQTRVATVLGKGFYTRFIKKFPDVHALASASDESLLKAWEGLGYYRRARMLRAAAIHLVESSGGKFPEDEEAILALPGIGPYTSAALLDPLRLISPLASWTEMFPASSQDLPTIPHRLIHQLPSPAIGRFPSSSATQRTLLATITP